MAMNISEATRLLDTISRQQATILEKLTSLLEIFSAVREPIEPELREILEPIAEPIHHLKQMLLPTSNVTTSEPPAKRE